MNNDDTRKLSGVIELLLDAHSRINENKPKKYWYPLSMATYGVEEIIESLDSLCSFRTTMWDKTFNFEKQFSDFQGCAESVMVNSGSSADLLLCFMLTNPLKPILKPGDEILIPVVTWPTQIWSAMMAGLKVRLVDVDPKTLNISIDDLERKITPNTKALFLVHLMGNPCEMGRIQEIVEKHNLVLVEDCCESLGSKWGGTHVGNFGVAGAFSFFFSHHISTMEGGMISCADPETAEQLRILRAHGWMRNAAADKELIVDEDIDPRYTFVNWGFNLRPTEIQSCFGMHQIKKLEPFNERRRQLAARFFDHIKSAPFLSSPVADPKSDPVWFALPLTISEDAPFKRRDITEWFEESGVETRPLVAGNIARHPAAKLFDVFDGEFPGADVIHKRSFYIGLSPFTSDDDMGRLIECLDQFLNRFK